MKRLRDCQTTMNHAIWRQVRSLEGGGEKEKEKGIHWGVCGERDTVCVCVCLCEETFVWQSQMVFEPWYTRLRA